MYNAENRTYSTGHETRFIRKRTPPIGGKIWCMKEKGLFNLEEGPCVFRTLAVTYVGNGGLSFFDGVPDAHGIFQGYDPDDLDSNGTSIHVHPGTVLGSWMLDGGCWNGLSVLNDGGMTGLASMGSIVWAPYKGAKPPTKETLLDAAKELPAPKVAGTYQGKPVVDVVRPPAPGRLTRSAMLYHNGIYRLARRDASLYSVEITHQGTYGSLRVFDAMDETLWWQPSAFTGSFTINGFADRGLLVEMYSTIRPPHVNVNWREEDQAIR